MQALPAHVLLLLLRYIPYQSYPELLRTGSFTFMSIFPFSPLTPTPGQQILVPHAISRNVGLLKVNDHGNGWEDTARAHRWQ
jgi:hypothetical protein